MTPRARALFEEAALWANQTTEYLQGCLRSLGRQRSAAKDRDDLASARELAARMKPIIAELQRRRSADEPTS